jgi:negative modulator of initiation of replication
MLVLSTLYSLDNKAFAEATESLHGVLASISRATSRRCCKMAIKPKHVPGTPYWVITNTNTGRKQHD